ncbi:MAG: hypothetical protein ACKVW3_14100 [Phycisphaerales bacterium]
MMMLLVALGLVALSGYLWLTRGFFSALIHLVCVIAAGAIAFGVWEPVSYLLLSSAPDRGFGSVLTDLSWALGLGLPFAISLAVLRVAIDKILPANAQCETTADYVGGAVCGVLSGVICAGILVLSLGFLRMGPDFWGYQLVQYSSGAALGNIERSPSKMVPWVDQLTAKAYSTLSETTLRTGTPLSRWHPDFAAYPASLRVTYEGKSRNTLKKDAISFLGWYTVGDVQRGEPMKDLLVDSWGDKPQTIGDLKGETPTTGYLAGFICELGSKAKEKSGQVLAGAAQARLACASPDGDEHVALHPVAVVTSVDDPTRVGFARFRFDSDNFFVASVGGSASAAFGFEFAVPPGFTPVALYVKGIRWNLEDSRPNATFATPFERDDAIKGGAMPGMGGVGPIIDPNTGLPVPPAPGQSSFREQAVTVQNGLGFGMVIQKGTEQSSLTVAEEGRGWAIVDGEAKFDPQRIGRVVDQKLQINKFSLTDDTVLVRVIISPSQRTPEFTKALDSADRNRPPSLMDTNGTRYDAVGFIYKDLSLAHFRYTKGSPLRGLGESGVPQVSRNTPERQMTLLFVVSRGVEISEFRVGDAVIETYSPTVKTNQR